MKLLFLLLVLIGVVCSNDEIMIRPHYPFPHYTNEGNLKWFPRIIGGTPAELGEFPGKTSLQYRRGSAHFCGGTLIDHSTVLTAAHCVTDILGNVIDKYGIQVMADDLVLAVNGSAARQVRDVADIHVHEEFDPNTFANDIAIISLALSFLHSPTLYPISRTNSTPLDGQRCSLAGWGSTRENATTPSPILRRVDLDIVNLERCNSTTSYQGLLLPGMLCAGFMEGGRDSCQGDSGGALMCNEKISGIVSFGYGCGRPDFPGVYVDVAQYSEWIDKTLESRDGERRRNSGDTLKTSMSISIVAFFLVASMFY